MGQTYPAGTPVWVQMRYAGEPGTDDHSKVPWIYVWVGKEQGEPLFHRRYSDFVQEAKMDKVFDPSELELADSRGDPGRVVEIQKLYRNFSEANRQRQQGIRAQLLEQGAWALPGLLNATYVWMNQLEDAQSQKLLSSLMADLASDNPAAVDLLFRDGILEAPFSIPRSISRRALDEINWVPDEANSIKLIQAIDKSGELYHTQTVLDLYALLLKRGASQDFSNALTKCKSGTKIVGILGRFARSFG